MKKTHTRDYIQWSDEGFMEKVLCKGCGTVLSSMVEGDAIRSTKKGNTIVKHVPLTLQQTAAYDVVTLEMEDGSAHETPICKSCKVEIEAGLFDEDDLFATDVRSWKYTAKRTKTSFQRNQTERKVKKRVN
jgi:hypothetical protein